MPFEFRFRIWQLLLLMVCVAAWGTWYSYSQEAVVEAEIEILEYQTSPDGKRLEYLKFRYLSDQGQVSAIEAGRITVIGVWLEDEIDFPKVLETQERLTIRYRGRETQFYPKQNSLSLFLNELGILPSNCQWTFDAMDDQAFERLFGD